MFARATSRSYTCLRCQHRLAFKERLPVDPTNSVRRAPRRWQTSAATAVVEHDQEEQDDNVRTTTGDEAYTFHRQPYATRRWRPAPTAEIGVDVLGKPAEILVLPDARRRRKANRKSVIKDGEEEGIPGQEVEETTTSPSGPGVHETLALESKPVSRKEALANIEHIRSEAEQNSRDKFLEEEQWLQYFKALSTGFTKKQLHQYILETATVSDPNSPQHESNVAAFTKAQATKDIMTRIWGLTNDLPKESERHVSKAFNMGWGKRELILGNEREWRRLLNHLHITSSPTRGWVDISGPESWVDRAQNVFTSLRKRVRAQVLALPTRFREALKDQTSRDGILARSMLQDLIQQHEITVTKGSEWIGYAFSTDRIARFERDLILCQKEYLSELGMTSKSLPHSVEPLDASSVMPVYDASSQIYTADLSRYVHSGSSSNREDTGSAVNTVSQDFIADLRNKTCDATFNTLDYVFPPGSRSEIGHVSTDFRIEIGQALHETQVWQDEPLEDTDSSGEITTFASTIPFMPQFLKTQPPQAVHENDPPQIEELSLHLNFAPSNSLTHPTLKVQATIPQDTGKALPSLTIKSVQLSFPKQSAYIAIPTAHFDLKLTRDTYVPIFQFGTTMQDIYAPLLGQLATQLKTQMKLRDKRFLADLNTLLDLDLTCLASVGDNKKDTLATRTDRSSETKVRYALDTASLVETRTYQVPELEQGGTPLPLEYTSSSPISLSSEQEPTETLKISDADGSALLADQDKFAAFVKSGFDVVGLLDQFVKQRSSEMIEKANQGSKVEVDEHAEQEVKEEVKE